MCHDGSIGERYRFCVDQYSQKWIFTKSDTSYALMFGRTKGAMDMQPGYRRVAICACSRLDLVGHPTLSDAFS